jgi:histidinol-phosphatase (PHP family)
MPKGPNYDLDYNYHSHTWRCGHATGTDEAYVKSAIANGFKIYGFSDHVILPNASQPGMRGRLYLA